MDVTIGERIGIIRDGKGISQTDLARAVGISRSQLAMIETNQRKASGEVLELIADSLGISLYHLITGIDDNNHSVFETIGLSNNAIEILKKQKDSVTTNMLSKIIENRLFFQLMKNIEILSKSAEDFNKIFASSVVFHLVSDLPYVDSPENIRSAYMYQTVKLFETMIDEITKEENNK